MGAELSFACANGIDLDEGMKMMIDYKIAALNNLYDRVKIIAREMGGAARYTVSSRRVRGTVSATERIEGAITLLARMPGNFRVEFGPYTPLGKGSALFVRVVRIHGRQLKSEWILRYRPEGWRHAQFRLSDDELQACLRPERTPIPFPGRSLTTLQCEVRDYKLSLYGLQCARRPT